MKRFVLFSLISVVFLVIAVVTGSPTKAYPAEVKPVKIGGLVSLSGAYAGGGQQAKAGIEFVIQEINKAGGIKSLGGAKIEVVFTDDKSISTTSVSEYERLIDSEKVVAVIGPYPTGSQMAVFPLAERYRVPVFGFGGAPILKEPLKYSRDFQVPLVAVIDMIVKNTFDFARECNIPIEGVALISYGTTAGSLIKGLFEGSVERAGVSRDKIVMNELYSAKADDLRPVVLKAKAAGARIVIFGGGVEHAILWSKACFGLDYYPIVFNTWSHGAGSIETWRGLGDKLARMTIGRPGWLGLSFGPPKFPYKPFQNYRGRFLKWAKQKKLGIEEIEMYHSLAGQMTYFLIRSIEMAGSRNPEEINKAAWNLTLKDGDPDLMHPIALPELRFDPKTNYPISLMIPFGFWNEKGGEEIAYPKKYRTAPLGKPVVK